MRWTKKNNAFKKKKMFPILGKFPSLKPHCKENSSIKELPCSTLHPTVMCRNVVLF